MGEDEVNVLVSLPSWLLTSAMGCRSQPDYSGEPDDGEDRQKTFKASKGFLSVVLPRIRGHSPAGVATSGPPYIILEDERLYKNWTVCQIWEQNNQGPANWDPTLFQSWGYTQGACY